MFDAGLKKMFKQAAVLLMVLSAAMLAPFAQAQTDSVCAVVKIEIQQELTLERQAFDSNMIITNSVDNISLESDGVNVLFTDEIDIYRVGSA